MKRNTISKYVNDSRPNRKLNIQRVKYWKDFIELIIYINNSSFDFHPLKRSEGIQRQAMRIDIEVRPCFK